MSNTHCTKKQKTKHWPDQNPVRSKASLKEHEDEQITLCVCGSIPTLNKGLYFEKIKMFVFDLILMAS